MTEPRDKGGAQDGPPRSFDPADKTQPAEGGRDEVEESLERDDGTARETESEPD
jgi:hypothetical protein